MSDFIDLNIKSDNNGGSKKVKVFRLGVKKDRTEYEELINSDATIIKENFAYDKGGMAVITVWWEKPA